MQEPVYVLHLITCQGRIMPRLAELLFLELQPFFSVEKKLKNGFCMISFEKISVLDSNFIHRYIIIKCRSSMIWGKIHQLFWELWPFFNFGKWFSFHNF